MHIVHIPDPGPQSSQFVERSASHIRIRQSGVSERLHLLSQMMLVPLAWRSTEINYSAANEYCAKHYARAAPYFAEDTRTEHVYDARRGVFDDDATTLRPASFDKHPFGCAGSCVYGSTSA